MKTLYRYSIVILILNFTFIKGYSTLIIPPDDMNEMINSCDIIVYGKMLNHLDEYGQINQFEIYKTFKGQLKENAIINVKEEGRRTENSIIKVSGDVDFNIGSHYLLFLFQDGSGYYRPQLLALSVYEEILIDNDLQLMHTGSLLDICFMDDLDNSLIGSYNSQDLLLSLSESLTSWNIESAGFKGEIPEKIRKPHSHKSVKKSAICTPPSHCTTLIGDPDLLNTTCNLGQTPSPAKYESTSFLIKVASGAQSDPSTPNEISNLMDAINELNNLDGLSVSAANPLVQNCATNTQESVADVVQVVCNPLSENEIWVFFDDPYNEIADLAMCSGVIGKGGTRATTPCHFDSCGNQWLTANQPYFFMNNGVGCLSDYSYTSTIIHEMMHGLNLNHINGSCTAIMNAFQCNANDPNAPNFGITQLDRDCVEWMYNQCPENKNLNNVLYNAATPVNVVVEDWITSANITVDNNAQVNFDAGNFVELNPLFEVKIGSIFSALIAGCTP